MMIRIMISLIIIVMVTRDNNILNEIIIIVLVTRDNDIFNLIIISAYDRKIMMIVLL